MKLVQLMSFFSLLVQVGGFYEYHPIKLLVGFILYLQKEMAKKKDTAPAKEGSGSGGQSTEMASMRTMMAALAVRTHPSTTFP